MSETEAKQQRRRAWVWWIGGLGALLVLCAALQPILLPRPSPVTKAAWDRIEKGMTRAQVEKILGGPPGDYQTRPIRPDYVAHLFRAEEDQFIVRWRALEEVPPGSSAPEYDALPGGSASEIKRRDFFLDWAGDEGIVRVGFDATGEMTFKKFWKMTRKSEDLVGLIRWRLRHIKHGWTHPSSAIFVEHEEEPPPPP